MATKPVTSIDPMTGALINSQVGDEAYSAVFTREAYLRGFQLSHEEVQAWLQTTKMAYDAGEMTGDMTDEELGLVWGGVTRVGGTTTTTASSYGSTPPTIARRRKVSFG